MSEDTRARADDTADDATAEAAPAEQAATEKRERGGSRKRGFALFLRDVALIIVAAIIISFLIKTFLIRSFYIPSESMEDTLLVNDRIIVNQLVPDLTAIERGDVIVFTDPGGWLGPVYQAPKDPVSGCFQWLGSIGGLTAPASNVHLLKPVIGPQVEHATHRNH